MNENEKIGIAQIILQQLGGTKFLTCTGAHSMCALKDGIYMKLPRNKSRANALRIILNGSDLYDMEFIHVTPARFVCNTKKEQCFFEKEKTETVKQYHDVFCDFLQELFTTVTGMVTHL